MDERYIYNPPSEPVKYEGPAIDNTAIGNIVHDLTEENAEEAILKLSKLPMPTQLSGIQYVVQKFPNSQKSRAFLNWCIANWNNKAVISNKLPPMFDPSAL